MTDTGKKTAGLQSFQQIGNAGFFKRGIDKDIHQILTYKDKSRYKLITLILSQFTGTITTLTLPSMWWAFENLLVEEADGMPVTFNMVGCENNKLIFNGSYKYSPGQTLNQHYDEYYDTHTYTTDIASMLYINVFDYMKQTRRTFDFIWLDLMSSIKGFMDKLTYLRGCTHKNSLVTVTFVKGRDGAKFIGKRKRIVSDIMLGLGFELIMDEEYRDTAPMIQLTFQRI